VDAMGENYFDTFTSVRRPEWLLAFQQNGRPKKGPKTSHGQPEVMFLTFLIQPNHERSLLSTSSPSALDEETWQELEKRIRSQFLSNPNLGMDKRTNVLSNHPLKTPQTTETQEIQNELETRRRILMKVSSNKEITKLELKKRKNRRKKNKKSKTVKIQDNGHLKNARTTVGSLLFGSTPRPSLNSIKIQKSHRTNLRVGVEMRRRKGKRRSKDR